jgi:hypothetical protein
VLRLYDEATGDWRSSLLLCNPVAFVKPPKDGGRPVLLEFDGLPEIPRWRNFIPCIFIASAACPLLSVEWSCCAVAIFMHVRSGGVCVFD